MRMLFTRPITCQWQGCSERATWREIDKYTQQGQTYTYFYYQCDEHKEKTERMSTVGHQRQFDKIA